jgi:hypothetical protein
MVQDGHTPAHFAALHMRKEALEWLFKHGADLEARNRVGVQLATCALCACVCMQGGYIYLHFFFLDDTYIKHAVWPVSARLGQEYFNCAVYTSPFGQ